MNKSEIKKLKEEINLLKTDNAIISEKLKDAEKFKTHFISNIMNEIYNPFTSILMLALNITNLNEGEMERAKQMAKLIHSEAFKLDFHLKNLFAAAKIEAGVDEIDISDIDINNLMKSVIHSFLMEIESKQIRINYNFESNSKPSFFSDQNKLNLIFCNLLSNAIKFNKIKGSVDINLKFINETLILEIKDEGKGIPPEKEKEIFNRFKRLDDTINSIQGGNGLGLSVVKAYTDLLNGKINIYKEGGIMVKIEIPQSTYIDDNETLFGEDELF